MKRIILALLVLLAGLIVWMFRPELISVVSLLIMIILILLALLVSAIAWPIKEYVFLNKSEKVPVSSMCHVLNRFRDTENATFYFVDGTSLVGELVSRSDAYNTIGIKYFVDSKSVIATVLQSDIKRIDLPESVAAKKQYSALTEWKEESV